jgi:hypothetical protein
VEAAPDAARLDELDARLDPAPCPRLAVQPAPGPRGDAWRQLLRERGDEPRLQRRVQMARDLRAAPQPATEPSSGLDVHERGPGGARPFAATVVAGFGLPPWSEGWLQRLAGRPGWHSFIADRDGASIATGTLFVHDGIGWLGIAATLPMPRGLGAQRSLMLGRLARATALGCRIATTETGAPAPGQPHPSFSNKLGCGFRHVATRTGWARSA